jgi:hypothetical protein
MKMPKMTAPKKSSRSKIKGEPVNEKEEKRKHSKDKQKRSSVEKPRVKIKEGVNHHSKMRKKRTPLPWLRQLQLPPKQPSWQLRLPSRLFIL